MANDLVETNESVRLLDAIVRAAADPAVSPEKMTALFDLHVKVRERAARLEFNAALARAQAKFPPVERRGKIVVYSKADRERSGGPPADAVPIQTTAYPLFEDVVSAITPALSEEGLSLSFKSKLSTDGKIVVVGFLKHRDGWVEEAETPPLKHDATGSKNDVQAVKSTMSYGRRMAAEMLTNFVSRGDDDDGAHGAPLGGGSDLISSEQYALILPEIDGPKTMDALLAAFKITSLTDLPASRFDEAMKRLADRRKRLSEARR